MANVATGETSLWECSSTGDYSWMTETAYPDVDSRVGKGTKVFISMGFNDLTAYQSYATSINAKAAEWQAKGAEVYFVFSWTGSSDKSGGKCRYYDVQYIHVSEFEYSIY